MPATTYLIPYPAYTVLALAQDPTPSGGPSGGSSGGPTGGGSGPVGGGIAVDPNDPNVPNGPNGAGQGGAGFANDIFLYMALFVGLMLFLSFRRESKARKEQQSMLSSIKQGDRVVTSSGIHGKVHKLEDRTVTLLLDTMQVTFERSAVARIIRDEAATDAAAKKTG